MICIQMDWWCPIPQRPQHRLCESGHHQRPPQVNMLKKRKNSKEASYSSVTGSAHQLTMVKPNDMRVVFIWTTCSIADITFEKAGNMRYFLSNHCKQVGALLYKRGLKT